MLQLVSMVLGHLQKKDTSGKVEKVKTTEKSILAASGNSDHGGISSKPTINPKEIEQTS